mmetsp:Transcript_26128/g.53897  ORF Transcript_26128/g.53897 Transcript_26128/m.53897 type:complete len:193 (+) Transcript_26128:704-1282(+)
MNESCGKPKASGIMLDSLIKTATTKGCDGKTTVLDYLISTVITNRLGMEKFWDDMQSVRRSKNINLEELRVVKKELEAGLKNVENLMNVETDAMKAENSTMLKSSSEKLLNRLLPFHSWCAAEIISLQKSFRSAEESAARLRKFFAEDVNTSTKAIFGVLIDFAQLVEQSNALHDRKNQAVKREMLRERALE